MHRLRHTQEGFYVSGLFQLNNRRSVKFTVCKMEQTQTELSCVLVTRLLVCRYDDPINMFGSVPLVLLEAVRRFTE